MPIANDFRHPLDGGYTLTQDHNQYYYNPDFGIDGYHLGEDWANGYAGGSVYSAAAGEVVFAGQGSGYGNMVVIRHTLGDGSTVTSYYAHLNSADVSVGDLVEIGDVIGEVGNTGTSTGPHLHFAIFVGDNAPTIPLGYSSDPDPDIRDCYVDPSVFIEEFISTGMGGDPDLIAHGLTLDSTTWEDGDTISADWTIENVGGADADSTPSNIYVSTNTTITTSDTLVGGDPGTGTMTAGEVNPEDDSFTLDLAGLGLAPGTYYVGVLADPNDDVAEDNENNNASNVIQVTITAPSTNPIIGTSAGEFLEGSSGDDTIVGLGGNDSLNGGSGDDIVLGGTGPDTVNGNDGNDILAGGLGGDLLNGDGGNDTLIGGAGNDMLNGGADDDVISGGTGIDMATGGAGADIFVYTLGDGVLTITDFEAGVDDFAIIGASGATFANLAPLLTQDGADVVIGGGAVEIRWQHTLVADLGADDFIFV